jgi:transposase
MSTKKRQPHPPAFKAKVALEAVKERLTVAQIASAYRVHPTQVGVKGSVRSIDKFQPSRPM